MFIFNVYSCVEEDYNYVIMYPTINVEACLRQKPRYVESISHILFYLQHLYHVISLIGAFAFT